MNDEYRLIAIWRIAAPQRQVFDAISDSLNWPSWWPGAESVRQLAEGDENGVGSVRRYAWKSRLPYRLGFDARATRVVTPDLLEASVSGDLSGFGRWSFSHADGVTSIRYEWHVRTTKTWMRALGPVAHALFANNHHALMMKGAHALAHRLGARLLEAEHGDLPACADTRGADSSMLAGSTWWIAGAAAGVIGGTVATGVQMILWWTSSHPPVEMLLRDSRLAAAIVLGRTVLPPPVTFDTKVMLAATLVHLALSVLYGVLLARLIARLNPLYAILAGVTFGLSLYWLNMYGFTVLFPWFAQSRDWITAMTHAAFGAAMAVSYQLCAKRLLRRQCGGAGMRDDDRLPSRRTQIPE